MSKAALLSDESWGGDSSSSIRGQEMVAHRQGSPNRGSNAGLRSSTHGSSPVGPFGLPLKPFPVGPLAVTESGRGNEGDRSHYVVSVVADDEDFVDDPDGEMILPQGNGSEQSDGLGTFMGVIVPCLLSMFGIILFERLSYVVGNSGLWWLFAFILVAMCVVLPTILSMCAIVTNGKMKGGGSYFMISRSLGPEIGGALGVVFWAANVFSASFYAKGVAQLIADELICGKSSPSCVWRENFHVIAIAVMCLSVMLAIALGGAGLFSKSASLLFACMVFSASAGIISIMASGSEDLPDKRIVGPNIATLRENLTPCLVKQSCADGLGHDDKPVPNDFHGFMAMFSLAFNGFSGFNAGANLSGDLKNPSSSIPIGTIVSVGIVAVSYLVVGTLFASAMKPSYLSAKDTGYYALQNASKYPALVYSGALVALFGSTLSSIVGASRILQAVSRDAVIPYTQRFAWGTPKANNPVPALLLTWLLVVISLFIPNIASVTTQMFLFCYSGLNFSCFALRATGAPNFRPVFKYFNRYISLAGSLICVVLAFLIEPLIAGGALIVCVGMVVVISFRSPQQEWGDIGQAFVYHQVRKYLLRLDQKRAHVKFWRPSMLLLLDDCGAPGTASLIRTVNSLKKGGLYVVGSVVVGSRDNRGEDFHQLQDAWTEAVTDLNVKAFPEIMLSPSLRDGIRSLLLGSGLGALRPNTVVLPLADQSSVGKSDPGLPELLQQAAFKTGNAGGLRMTAAQLCSAFDDALFFRKNVVISTGFDLIESRRFFSGANGAAMHSSSSGNAQSGSIYVWCIPHFLRCQGAADFKGFSFNLALQLAWVLKQTSAFRHCTLRVAVVCDKGDDQEKIQNEVDRLLLDVRVDASTDIISLDHPIETWKDKSVLQRVDALHCVMMERQQDCVISLVNVPSPTEMATLPLSALGSGADEQEDDVQEEYRDTHGLSNQRCTAYVESLSKLGRGFPTFMVHGVQYVVTSEL